MIRVTLYTRDDCARCDEARHALASLQSEHPHQMVELNVDRDAALKERFGEQIPVVQAGPYVLKPPFDVRDLRVLLASARDRAERVPPPTEAVRRRVVRADRAVLAIARHWLALANLLLFLYVAPSFAAPVLMKAGAAAPARWIYKAYSIVCHQLGFRSWYLFGEQPAYPRQAAGLELVSFGEATGLDENDLRAARDFVGDPRLGYKVALCQRDLAIYGSMLLGGLLYAVLRRRLKPLPIWLWLVFGVGPIALDGGTQILGAFPFLSALARESTPLLRTVTGASFGLANVWMAFPMVQESMDEVAAAVIPKLAAADRPGTMQAA